MERKELLEKICAVVINKKRGNSKGKKNKKN
jgi:hypothetical protein